MAASTRHSTLLLLQMASIVACSLAPLARCLVNSHRPLTARAMVRLGLAPRGAPALASPPWAGGLAREIGGPSIVLHSPDLLHL